MEAAYVALTMLPVWHALKNSLASIAYSLLEAMRPLWYLRPWAPPVGCSKCNLCLFAGLELNKLSNMLLLSCYEVDGNINQCFVPVVWIPEFVSGIDVLNFIFRLAKVYAEMAVLHVKVVSKYLCRNILNVREKSSYYSSQGFHSRRFGKCIENRACSSHAINWSCRLSDCYWSACCSFPKCHTDQDLAVHDEATVTIVQTANHTVDVGEHTQDRVHVHLHAQGLGHPMKIVADEGISTAVDLVKTHLNSKNNFPVAHCHHNILKLFALKS